MDFRTRYAAPDDAALAALEAQIGSPLPGDYREWLRANGGGVTEDDLKYGTDDLDVDEATHPVVTIFFGLGVEHAELDLVRSREVYAGRVPDDLTPIGTNDAGDLVCLAVAGEAPGSVWSWAHEEEAATRVSAGFTPFVEGLRPIPW